MIDPVHISIRPAGEDDKDFCFQVKKAALGPYVADTWGWNEADQLEIHHQDWQARKPDIIMLNHVDIGTIEIAIVGDHYHLGEFYLLPEYQGQGIGTHLLHRLTIQADVNNAPIQLRILRANPVRKLYERHGFVVRDHSLTHLTMERPAKYGSELATR